MLQQLRSKSLVIWAIVFVFFVVGVLLADTSGLLGLGSAAITPGTTGAEVAMMATSSCWLLAPGYSPDDHWETRRP